MAQTCCSNLAQNYFFQPSLGSSFTPKRMLYAAKVSNEVYNLR